MESTIRHLAVIMDGNRRWAKKQKLSFGTAYAQGGTNAIKTTAEFCIKKGIKYLSLYAFSLENFKRPQEEQDFLFDSIVNQGEKNVPYFKEHQICVKFVGERSRFPERVLPVCEVVEDATKDFSQLYVNILFCYGGRQELVNGVRKIVAKVKSGLLSEDAISEAVLADALWTAGTPDPELIIRTSGVSRFRNFLLYQAAYSEFCFLDCLWPEITTEHLTKALDSFLGVRRNFGV